MDIKMIQENNKEKIMRKWNFNSIPDQHGRIALVTGANSGIGYQTSLALAKKGTEVILACRDMSKADQAYDSIFNEYPEAKLSIQKLDLSDLDRVSQCVETIKEKYDKLDLLINNTGVMIPPLTRIKQGLELQFGTNH
jgi:NAD(P)-dependent dehydrogenase (short-subunit alcohol dehydrogenase family)